MTNILNNDSTGTYVITTAASRYVIDLDARTAVREPGAGTGEKGFLVNRWEDDDAVMQEVAIVGCEVGYPLVLTTDFGWLRSTPVRKIEPFTQGDAA